MAKFHPQVVLWNASRLALLTLLLEDKGCSASVSGETGAYILELHEKKNWFLEQLQMEDLQQSH